MASTNLNIDLTFSKALCAWLSLLTLGSLIVIGQLTIGPVFKILICSIILAYGAYIFRRDIQRDLDNSWLHIQTIKNNEWLLVNRSGKYFAANLRRDSFISSQLIILRFNLASNNKQTSIALARDALTAELWRRLNIYLRWPEPTSGMR